MAADESHDDRTQSFTVLISGTVVLHYKIIEKIGTGGMGEVYLALDTKLNRKVALKFLPPHLCQNEDCRARFKREAQATAALKHPNIVTIYEVSEFQGRPFFAMEYLEGRSLDAVIKSKKLSPDQVVNLAVQLCEGLHEAHQAGVIHRDIKPSNILLDKNNRPKLLDFGLATVKGTEKLTQTGSTLGTIGYMSPEQVEGKPTDQRSDLFSLGVLLYELITSIAPFKRDNEATTFYAIAHEPPEPMARYKSGVPDDLQRVVSKLLEKDPDLRYQSAEGVLPDLKRLVVSGSRDQEKLSSTPKQKLRKALLPTSVVALIILLVLILKPWRFEITSDDPALAAPRRLAVLYLTNRGAADDEYLSYGITEDLIVDLTRIGTMGVAPMPSILKYKDSDEELDKIAQHLQVGLVLNGSIHKSGDLIRVSAQLIDVESELNLWADRWEETFENLPRIKEALAQGISQALEIDASVMRAAQVGTPDAENPVAYDYYLRGKYTFERKSDESDVEVALGLFRKALELEPSLLAARRGVAAVLRFRGQYDQAIDELNTALAEARQRNLRSDEAEALLSLAGTHYLQSLYDEAQGYAEQALGISKELNDLAGEVKALTSIISIYQARGMFNEAVALFDRILEINRHLNDQSAVATSLNNIGNINWSQGDYVNALHNYEQAYEIYTRIGHKSGMATITMNIGIIYKIRGDYAKGLQKYEQALEVYTRLGDQRGMGMVTTNIGNIYCDQGDYAKGLQKYEQALEVYTRLGDQ
ncbi:MAG: protein kinase, partial [candidate division Zixibacteria bacterium]|nr:protein kinase [candidate division Zixibacteria bacterium]